mmetsp:Transcript_7087/g.21627  ORF Transcript_7087/g.21627 Transcript_7087/m.21627 type:complete len:207 (+) Transcript_7087:76-696(+)
MSRSLLPDVQANTSAAEDRGHCGTTSMQSPASYLALVGAALVCVWGVLAECSQRVLGLAHLIEQLVRARVLVPFRVNVELQNGAVGRNHRVAMGAKSSKVSGVLGKANGLGEFGVAVCDHLNLALPTELLSKGLHHKRIVHGDHIDIVDALLLQLVSLVDEGRDVLVRTSRSEGSRNCADGHGLPLQNILRLLLLAINEDRYVERD